MNSTEIELIVNGVRVKEQVESRRLLVHTLRDSLRLTGAHVGCDTSQCGACTVLINGKTTRSCTVLTVQAEGDAVQTIEGMVDDDIVAALMESFNALHGLQCGFCTPAMLLSARALLQRVGNPTEHEVRDALHGNLCRCTGYQNIIDAVLQAAEKLAGAAGRREGMEAAIHA